MYPWPGNWPIFQHGFQLDPTLYTCSPVHSEISTEQVVFSSNRPGWRGRRGDVFLLNRDQQDWYVLWPNLIHLLTALRWHNCSCQSACLRLDTGAFGIMEGIASGRMLLSCNRRLLLDSIMTPEAFAFPFCVFSFCTSLWLLAGLEPKGLMLVASISIAVGWCAIASRWLGLADIDVTVGAPPGWEYGPGALGSCTTETPELLVGVWNILPKGRGDGKRGFGVRGDAIEGVVASNEGLVPWSRPDTGQVSMLLLMVADPTRSGFPDQFLPIVT